VRCREEEENKGKMTSDHILIINNLIHAPIQAKEK